MTSGNKKLGAVVLVAFLGAVHAQLACGQLHSRPAAVVLIATLESLSVSATPEPVAIGQDGAPEEGSERVEVKTSWAVPARRTTLQLTGGLSSASPTASGSNEADPAADMRPHQNGRRLVRCQSATDCRETIQSGEGVMTLMKEAAGEGNQAASRTNSVNLVFAKKNKSRVTAAPAVARFDLQVEAL
jgi:hypothetical protein